MASPGLHGVSTKDRNTALSLEGDGLFRLQEGWPLHQIPVTLWTKAGLALTRNPVQLEATETGLRCYFMPVEPARRGGS